MRRAAQRGLTSALGANFGPEHEGCSKRPQKTATPQQVCLLRGVISISPDCSGTTSECSSRGRLSRASAPSPNDCRIILGSASGRFSFLTQLVGRLRQEQRQRRLAGRQETEISKQIFLALWVDPIAQKKHESAYLPRPKHQRRTPGMDKRSWEFYSDVPRRALAPMC